MPAAKKKNRKHFKRTAAGLKTEITEFDAEDIFAPLARHAQLSTTQLIGYGRRYVSRTRGKLGALYHVTEKEKEHYLHRVNEEILFANHVATEDLHRLGKAGLGVLTERGLVPDEPWVMNCKIGGKSLAPNRLYRLSHDHMASDMALDVEIGARKAKAPYSSHVDILIAAPEATRARNKPLKIPITLDGEKTHVEGDAYWRVGSDYYVLEADKGTESIEAVIVPKCLAWREAVASGAIEEAFGIDLDRCTFTVLFATTSEARKKHMMAELKKIVAKGRSPMFGFRAELRFADFLTAEMPTGELFAAEWERVGFEPLTIEKGRA